VAYVLLLLDDMGTENFFRLLSIALLGLIGLVAVPNREAEPVQAQAIEISSPEDDIRAALEVNQINAGRFRPYMIEEDSVEVSDLDMLELELMAQTHITR
jgi:hypothetical protein